MLDMLVLVDINILLCTSDGLSAADDCRYREVLY